MGRSYKTEDTHDVSMTLEGSYIEATVHTEGWYFEGDSWGYGEEPPDGEENVVDVDITLAYNEETGKDLEVTEELKKKVMTEAENGNYW